MKWLRLYDDLLDDPKVQKLPAPLFRHWINLLCLANKGTVRGVLPEMSDIAFRLRVEEDRAEEIVAALSAAGLIEYDDAGQLHPHNWETRQATTEYIIARRIWSKLQPRIAADVFERDGFVCVYCGSIDDLTVDHVIPVSSGGNNELSNLATACRSCNSAKGAKTLEEWNR